MEIPSKVKLPLFPLCILGRIPKRLKNQPRDFLAVKKKNFLKVKCGTNLGHKSFKCQKVLCTSYYNSYLFYYCSTTKPFSTRHTSEKNLDSRTLKNYDPIWQNIIQKLSGRFFAQSYIVKSHTPGLRIMWFSGLEKSGIKLISH